jgi:RNA polymerase sigma-70 factor (ECF subfamily)
VGGSDNASDLGEIQQSYAAARTAWPTIEVAFTTFAARLATGNAAYASDLYLACACSDGDPTALAELDRIFLHGVPAAIARIDRSHDFVSEVQQILRERLLVGEDAKIRDYRGGGPLASWIRTAAVRTALNLRRRSQQEHKRGGALEALEPILDDPEVILLRERYMPEIDAALRQAIAALDAKDRLLLHYYYVDGLTLAKIAALDRVGTSTVFRRITAAMQRVLASVKRALSNKLQLSITSLDSLLRNVRDDIDLSLSQVLGKP